ncbi:GFA family protein [Variovorax sp. dw_954]|uniref:GFA family protein n=1 Tax=Variovorax sp. dw_954 TaxID=2720078 RepID=UPI001BD64141|nr:GFA family protein [Variovorax sp. dw_954]
MPTYQGSCHCGAIRFEIDTVIDRVTQCNCSVCTKKGILHHRVAPENFRLLGGDETLGTYQFGTRVAKHHFCTVCGIQTFTRPRAAPELYTVNVRCLDDYDLQAESPEIVPFDGRHWEQEVGKLT